MEFGVFILIIQFSFISGIQEWLEVPRYTEVNPRGSVILPCRFNNKKGECRWERNSLPVGIYPGKYEWAGEVNEGDCSLHVLNAQLEYDDGDWVCQVTASSYQEKDTLISQPAKLVIRVAPTSVFLRMPGEAGQLDGDLVAAAGDEVDVECVAGGGNPAPELIWYLADRVWEGRGEVVERTKGEQVSRLRIPVTKEDHGTEVRCEVRHEALEDSEIMGKSTNLDIHFAPRVEVEQLPNLEITEGENLELRCSVSANPPAQVYWTREGTKEVVGNTSNLLIANLGRAHADTYICQARNSLGLSAQSKIPVSVKYGPVITSVGPKSTVRKLIGDSVQLTCAAEGFPNPSYAWVQVTSQGEILRSETNTLDLNDIRFSDQGVYVCQASNTVRGERRIAKSETITVEVEGSPVLQAEESNHYVVTGTDAKVEIEFCADPQPMITWVKSDRQKEQVISTAGDRYTVDHVAAADRPDCYTSTLTVKSPTKTETHEYLLKLKNSHGEESHRVFLKVGEVYSQQMLIGGVVGGCLTLVLIVIVLGVSCRRCCSSKDKKIKQDIERNV